MKPCKVLSNKCAWILRKCGQQSQVMEMGWRRKNRISLTAKVHRHKYCTQKKALTLKLIIFLEASVFIQKFLDLRRVHAIIIIL